MARVIVLRDDGDYQVPESFLRSKHGHIRRPVSRTSLEQRIPVELNSAIRFSKRGAKKHTVPEFTNRLDDKWHHHDDTIVLKVNFNGYPEPMVFWFKDQVPVFSEMRHMVHNTDYSTELVIFNAQKEDCGFYTCRIENDMGIRETNCRVYIGDTPNRVSKSGKTLTPNFSAVYSNIFIFATLLNLDVIPKASVSKKSKSTNK